MRNLRFTFIIGMLVAGCGVPAPVPTSPEAPQEAPPPAAAPAEPSDPSRAMRALKLSPDEPFQDTAVFTPASQAKELIDIPPLVRRGNRFAVRAVAGTKQLLPSGPATRMILLKDDYASRPANFPGPSLDYRAGERPDFQFTNALTGADPNIGSPPISNIHFHGLVIDPEQDGNPHNQVSPGSRHVYTLNHPADLPLTSWYHAHPHGATHLQVPRGMQAPMRVLGPDDDRLRKLYREHMIMLVDQRFDKNNQIPPDTEFERFNGREGPYIFTSGQLTPKITMAPGEVRRLFILNGSQARLYNLVIPGVKITQIGTDGGLINQPIVRDRIVLSNAERVEVLVEAPRTPNTVSTMVTQPIDRGLDTPFSRITRPILHIVTSNAPAVTPKPIPAPLRLNPVPQIPASEASVNRHFALGFRSFDAGGNDTADDHFVIDEKIHDPLRIDDIVTFGRTEIWTIENTQGNWDHPMHLHNVQFQVLDVDGQRPDTGPAWKDVVRVPRNSTARIITRFNTEVGHFPFHCHILQHEDDGMMTAAFVQIGAPTYHRGEELEHPRVHVTR